jgi:hypothetical protein
MDGDGAISLEDFRTMLDPVLAEKANARRSMISSKNGASTGWDALL